ncbi:MAG: type II toxin-antitoxin system RelE/ParE family toxin [Crocinitomicaceae bacterium]
MDQKQKTYLIIITGLGEEKYYKTLEYIYEHYSEQRADEIAEELLETPEKLTTFPQRGKTEENLEHRPEGFRYILYKRSNHATVKVIYYIDEPTLTVYVTDFFPTEMNHHKIKRRS